MGMGILLFGTHPGSLDQLRLLVELFGVLHHSERIARAWGIALQISLSLENSLKNSLGLRNSPRE